MSDDVLRASGRRALGRGRVSVVVSPRALAWGIAMACIALALAVVALSTGSSDTPIADVIAALVGQADERTTMLVIGWRLPRVLLAILCGLALGSSGALFQSLTQNPLGSPDVIGLSTGAYTGALVVMLGFGSLRFADIAQGALLGAMATVVLVMLLTIRGGARGFRLIIVGIGVSAMLGSVNSAMLMNAGLNDAMVAAGWGAGSLNGVSYEHLPAVAVSVAVLLPVAMLLARPVQQLELGEDLARAGGVRATASRLASAFVGVALIAAATAVAGPIAFVALAAPQISRRLTRATGAGVGAAAVTGAALLLAADLVAARMQLPVGVITVFVGGTYLLWLLTREMRNRP